MAFIRCGAGEAFDISNSIILTDQSTSTQRTVDLNNYSNLVFIATQMSDGHVYNRGQQLKTVEDFIASPSVSFGSGGTTAGVTYAGGMFSFNTTGTIGCIVVVLP